MVWRGGRDVNCEGKGKVRWQWGKVWRERWDGEGERGGMAWRRWDGRLGGRGRGGEGGHGVRGEGRVGGKGEEGWRGRRDGEGGGGEKGC